uniref:Integrin subunit beta like 1 n=1 Tax=Sus scrofa TaxID=9823 RepID=A0A4X1UC86_PIG
MGGLGLPIQRVVRLRLGSGWTLGGKVKATWARITGAVSGLDRGPAVVCRPCRSGPGAACRLSRAESERRCRAPGQPPGGALCHGRGRCDCGVCICHVSEPGVYFGPLCECHEWVCETYDGSTCAGICVCGECSCHDVDPTGDWGDVHGDTCECDERDCRAVYDRYSDDFCSGHGQCNCGRCDCKVGWYGKKCEHPRSCPLTAEESLKKCQGSSALPCSGRGKCECGRCTCYPPGDSRVYGKTCECDNRRCEDLDGVVCGGHGSCSCGRCLCERGWFGKLCQHPRKCNMTEEQSKGLCESADGTLCSGKGSCHCGKCICSAEEWYISGEFCDCDDRDCDKHDGLICTGNGICNCGNCECWDGWNGNACEIWLGTEYP